MTERPEKWRYGVGNADQPKLQPLLDALKKLHDYGLTMVGVIATFHR